MAAYCTVAYFRQNAPSAQAFTNLADAVIESALTRWSRWLDGYLIRKFKLPLVSWEDDVRGAVTDLAAYQLIRVRGFNPDTGDATIVDAYKEAVKWANSIPLGTTPLVVDSSGGTTPGVNNLTPTVTTATQRGWSTRPTQPSAANPPAGDYQSD